MANKVNGEQTKEERKAKYHLARTFGYNSYQAKRMRDWRKTHFIKFLYFEKINKG